MDKSQGVKQKESNSRDYATSRIYVFGGSHCESMGLLLHKRCRAVLSLLCARLESKNLFFSSLLDSCKVR